MPSQRLLGLHELLRALRQVALGARRALVQVVELTPKRDEMSLTAREHLLTRGHPRVRGRRSRQHGLPLALGDRALPLLDRPLAALELGEQMERLLRRAAVTGALALYPVGQRADALPLRRQIGLAARQLCGARVEPRPLLRLALGDRVDTFLQPRALAR
ncbi:MAG: hypothetical protein JO064_11240, partial [Actinobacteria bacterium]|nr:hypothetical protein [Actinomycetota bacterium]